MLNDFGLRISDDGPGSVRLELQGDLDMTVAPQLLDSLLCAALAYDRHMITVDFKGVTFMDSSGLSVLVEFNRRLRREQSHMVVANPPPLVLKVMELTGLDTYLDIRPASLQA